MEAEPTPINLSSSTPEKRELSLEAPQPTPPVRLGNIALAGARNLDSPDKLGDWRLESQRIAQLAATLQSMAAPYAEAAQKIVPQDTVGKRRTPWRKKQGIHTYTLV